MILTCADGPRVKDSDTLFDLSAICLLPTFTGAGLQQAARKRRRGSGGERRRSRLLSETPPGGQRDFSVVLPFLFKSLVPVALRACSYFALWETFSLATVANLSTSEKVGANSSPAVEHVRSPSPASSSPNYPGAMRHVRMYSSRHCQACFQPVLFNWSSL